MALIVTSKKDGGEQPSQPLSKKIIEWCGAVLVVAVTATIGFALVMLARWLWHITS